MAIVMPRALLSLLRCSLPVFISAHLLFSFFFFFFNDTATTEIYTLSLHDALPIFLRAPRAGEARLHRAEIELEPVAEDGRSEEHTSELQSRLHLVCRLLLEKKKKKAKTS